MRFFLIGFLLLCSIDSQAVQHSKTHTYITVKEDLLVIDRKTGTTQTLKNIVPEYDLWQFYIYLPEDQDLGCQPWGYIVSQSSGVEVLNLTTHKIEKTIYAGSHPIHMSFHNQKGYIVNYMANSICCIDLKENDIVCTVSVGRGPITMTHYGGKGYVVNNTSSTITIFDLETYNVLDTLKIGGCPMQMDVYKGKGFVVANSGHCLFIVDLETDRFEKRIKVEENPFKLFIYKNKGYIIYNGSPIITILDLPSKCIKGSLESHGIITQMKQHDSYFYVRDNASEKVTVFDCERDQRVTTFNTPNRDPLDCSDTHLYSGSFRFKHLAEIEGYLLFNKPFEGIEGSYESEDGEEAFNKFQQEWCYKNFPNARKQFDRALACANGRAYAMAFYAFTLGVWGAEENYTWAKEFISGMDFDYYLVLCKR